MWIYEKILFFIFAPAYEWKLIFNFEAIMFCLLKVRHALHAVHSWTLRPWSSMSGREARLRSISEANSWKIMEYFHPKKKITHAKEQAENGN